MMHLKPHPTDRHRASPLSEGYGKAGGYVSQKHIPKVIIGHFYKSPRRGVTFINTVQAMNGVATEREQLSIAP